MLAPKVDTKKKDVLPKDVVFVFDTSGSMTIDDDKLTPQAKALKYCLRALGKKDRFNLVAFSTQARPFRGKLLDVTDENVKAAALFVDEQAARGGTDIDGALSEALKMRPEEKRPFMIVLLTDGEPTVGITEPDKIIANVTKANTGRARIFTLGIGSELNVHLLDRLAQDNFAASEYLDAKENIEVKISAFYDKISFPVLSGASVGIRGLETYDVYPAKLGDIFKGQQITLLGRFKGEGTKAVVLKGTVNGTEKEFVFEAPFKAKQEADYIPVLWANRKVAYLLDNIRLHGEKKELKDEVVKLAIKYGIMTPYTSYLVTEDVKRPMVAGPVPETRRILRNGVRLATPGKKEKDMETWHDMKKSTGEKAADASKKLNEGKGYGQSVADVDKDRGARFGPAGKFIKRVGEKAFYNDDGRWVDSTYVKGKLTEVKVKAWTDEFFKLLKEIPKLGEYFTIGDKVTVVYNGKAYIMGND
jgi:Ca-activated chloride channel family protein